MTAWKGRSIGRPCVVGGLAIALMLLVVTGACDRGRGRDWSRHDAHRMCAAAIAAYPGEPAPPCQAMHMCANEADLTDQERDKLAEMISRERDCPAP